MHRTIALTKKLVIQENKTAATYFKKHFFSPQFEGIFVLASHPGHLPGCKDAEEAALFPTCSPKCSSKWQPPHPASALQVPLSLTDILAQVDPQNQRSLARS